MITIPAWLADPGTPWERGPVEVSNHSVRAGERQGRISQRGSCPSPREEQLQRRQGGEWHWIMLFYMDETTTKSWTPQKMGKNRSDKVADRERALGGWKLKLEDEPDVSGKLRNAKSQTALGFILLKDSDAFLTKEGAKSTRWKEWNLSSNVTTHKAGCASRLPWRGVGVCSIHTRTWLQPDQLVSPGLSLQLPGDSDLMS